MALSLEDPATGDRGASKAGIGCASVTAWSAGQAAWSSLLLSLDLPPLIPQGELRTEAVAVILLEKGTQVFADLQDQSVVVTLRQSAPG